MKQTLNMYDSQNTLSAVKTSLNKELIQLIGVTSPYFALTNLSVDYEGYLCADAPIEMKEDSEYGSISLSEVGRHMGVLGSLAMANKNTVKEKHYYLIKEVCFDTLNTDLIEREQFLIRARVIQISKKGGTVHVQLFTDKGTLQYSGEINYTIIHHRVFERRFRYAIKGVENIYGKYLKNPYTQSTSIYFHKKRLESFTAYINYIDPNDCIGHFHNYPVLPASRICEAIQKVTEKHYGLLHSDDSKYYLKSIELNAYSFIPAGENAKIVTNVVLEIPETTVIEARIFKNRDFKCVAVEAKIRFNKK